MSLSFKLVNTLRVGHAKCILCYSLVTLKKLSITYEHNMRTVFEYITNCERTYSLKLLQPRPHTYIQTSQRTLRATQLRVALVHALL
jgi:hypothetical protein